MFSDKQKNGKRSPFYSLLPYVSAFLPENHRYRQKEMITALFNSGFETAFTTSDSTTSLSAEMPY